MPEIPFLWGASGPVHFDEQHRVMARFNPHKPKENPMLFRLLKALLPRREWQQMEDHFSRQADAAEREIVATAENLKAATRKALSLLDPDIHHRYQAHLRRTANPALAEIATIRDVQTQTLNRAFSVLDFGHTQPVDRDRTKRRRRPV